MDWRDRIVEIKRMKVSEIAGHPLNPRKHPKQQADALRGMLNEVGKADVLRAYTDSTGKVKLWDGHLRQDLDPDQEWWVAITDLTEQEAALMLVAFDPIAALAEQDAERLDALLRDVQTGDAALQAMLAQMAESAGLYTEPPKVQDAGPQIDRAEELRQLWGVEPGQMWQLGEHRLICGDCTDAETVRRVMGGERAELGLHDPPYGIGIVGNAGTAGNFPGTNAPRLKAQPIAGDDKPFDPKHLLEMTDKVILWGGNHYADKLPSGSKWLVWDKKDGAFQESDLGDCELAWTNLSGAARLLHHTWQGMYRKGAGERSERMHPTQKPVALMVWCIEQANVDEDAIVIDFYLGSGTTLIACEQLSRRCRAVEISPGYVAVALQRWADATGQTPQLLE